MVFESGFHYIILPVSSSVSSEQSAQGQLLIFMAPPFRSSWPIVLTPAGANHLLRLLEDNMPLSPELDDLYQLMVTQAYSQDGVTHEEHPWLSGQTSPIDLWQLEILPGLHSALLGGPSDPVRRGEDVQHLHVTGSFSLQESCTLSTNLDPWNMPPTPERSLTPTSHTRSLLAADSPISSSILPTSFDPCNTLPAPESFLTLTSRSRSLDMDSIVHNFDPRNMLPTPERSLTPTSHSRSLATDSPISSSIISNFDPRNMLPTPERSLTPTSTIHRRARGHTEGMDDQGSSYPAKRRRKHTHKAGMLAQPSEPSHPPRSDPPHNNDCPRGARHLHVRAGGAHVPNDDPLRPGDRDLEGEEGSDSEGDVEQEEETVDAHTRGSWQRRPTDDPKISCSDQAITIIAELASAHYLSSIYKPLCWLQDIGDHLHTPSVEDESLLSVVARCRWISSRDICVNFMVMVNYMTLVFKCQRCVFSALRSTLSDRLSLVAYASRRALT